MQRPQVLGVELDSKEIRRAPTRPGTALRIQLQGRASEPGLQAAGTQDFCMDGSPRAGGKGRGKEGKRLKCQLTSSGQQLPRGFRPGKGYRTQACLPPMPEPHV